MVPVGGAVIYSPDQSRINEIAKLYPGRASMSPILDLFVTLLSMGETGLKNLWKERERLFVLLKEKLRLFAESHNECLVLSDRNEISIGVSLESLASPRSDIVQSSNGDTDITDKSQHENEKLNLKKEEEEVPKKEDSREESQRNQNSERTSFLGSMLFQRNVSGCRIIPKSNSITSINGIDFISWGAHISDYPISYFTAACSIGITESDIHLFIDRLEKTWKKFEKLNFKNNYATADISIAQKVAANESLDDSLVM